MRESGEGWRGVAAVGDRPAILAAAAAENVTASRSTRTRRSRGGWRCSESTGRVVCIERRGRGMRVPVVLPR